MNDDRLNLYDLAPRQLEATLGEIVSPPFRVKQIEEWMYVHGVDSFDAMSNLPKDVRATLAERYTLAQPEVLTRTEPASDGSQKYLFKLADGQRIESVYMPMGDRTSICLSSQAGCAVGCTFCVTGFFGAGRNLTPGEMLGQFFTIQREKEIPPELMNVVFMGMGEPLLNFDNLVATLDILYRNLAPRRITVSTSGIIPGIEALATLERRPNLAISVNAPDRKRREEIMPITSKYPLGDLMAALRRFPLEKGRDLTIEYVLLAGYNDSNQDAIALAKLIRGIRGAKVNAIPFNEDANLPKWMKRPGDRDIDRFVDTLVRNGVRVTVRRSKGRDIAAACGQLRGKEVAKSRATGGRPLRTASESSSEADSRR
ncbi:MAG TPA: 23S rRNA (adenine(2503)-C(2))-methyltransferase RlmN [Thermoanaerobaculia bacterium]|nr:23S rRNA (adenine(2503)-C(2))-methyltransferase RlmN [Thermoanaerobaculia bacterium]